MSEFLNGREDRNATRRQLLATASAIALLSAFGTSRARAEDSARPIVWVELDGQFSREENGAAAYIPPFLSLSPFDAISHLGLEKGPATIWDEGAKLSFQPERSDWVISAAVRYGKNARHATVEGHPTTANVNKYNQDGYNAYQNFTVQSSESHAILDFQAGKDVGLGAFGSGGSSVFSIGVRFAKFDSRSSTIIKSQPTNIPLLYGPYHKFAAAFDAKRKFTGVGPSLSWDASANLIGNPGESSFALDWGINGAVLFGRQTVRGHHQTTNNYIKIHFTPYVFPTQLVYQHSAPISRSKNVVVPNLGGFAGVSWRLPNAKVSVGYRADMFFGAIDGGIDATHRESRGFYGPFASVSVGLGG